MEKKNKKKVGTGLLNKRGKELFEGDVIGIPNDELRCVICKRTIDQIMKDEGEFTITSGEPFICNHCKALEEHWNWYNGMRKYFNVDKLEAQLKIAEKALVLACETLDKHFWICCDGIYSDTKESWIKRFKREAKEILNEKRNRDG